MRLGRSLAGQASKQQLGGLELPTISNGHISFRNSIPFDKLGIDNGCILCYGMRNMLSITVMHNMTLVFF